MSKTMAEVLAEHTADWCDWAEDPDDIDYYTCLCKEARWNVNSSADYYAAHAKHVAAALSAAGFGLVADAKAKLDAVNTLIQGWEQRQLSIRQSQMVIALKEAIEGDHE